MGKDAMEILIIDEGVEIEEIADNTSCCKVGPSPPVTE